MKYEIDIFHYLAIYKREWKRMVFLIVIAVFITTVIGFMRPKIYRSTLIALSSGENSQTGNFGRLAGLLNFSVGGSSSNDTIFAILKSKRMRKVIEEHFSLKNIHRFWWQLDTYIVTGGFAVEVKGPDPEMTRKIADFAVANLDKINTELALAAPRVEIKVLDPAEEGVPVKRDIFKKCIAIGLFVFLIYTLFIFFKEYFSHLKILKKQ